MTLTRSRHKRRAEKASGAPRTAERRPSARVGAEDAAPPPTTLPTPERVARAGGMIERGETGGIRVLSPPVERLAARCMLVAPVVGRPVDRERNAILHFAAKRFYEDWYAGGLGPLRSPPLGGTISAGGGDPAWAIPMTETSMKRRDEWRRARAALPEVYRCVVGAVVLDERELEDIGREISGYGNRDQARAVALDRLRCGLDVLVEHYGLEMGKVRRLR